MQMSRSVSGSEVLCSLNPKNTVRYMRLAALQCPGCVEARAHLLEPDRMLSLHSAALGAAQVSAEPTHEVPDHHVGPGPGGLHGPQPGTQG